MTKLEAIKHLLKKEGANIMTENDYPISELKAERHSESRRMEESLNIEAVE